MNHIAGAVSGEVVGKRQLSNGKKLQMRMVVP